MQEVAEAVKRGDQQAMEDLFIKNRGLLYSLAKRYKSACERDRAADIDDLIQAGYIGLVNAVRAWEPERGAWSNIAMMCVKKTMRQAVGIRGTRIRAEHGAVELDKPIGEDAAASLMDILEDDTAPGIEDAFLVGDLRRQVREAVNDLGGNQARVIWAHDIECTKTYDEIGAEMGLTKERVRQIREKGHAVLRKNQVLRDLAGIDEQTRFYAHKGITAFNADWTSTTEAAALWRIERLEQLEAMRRAREAFLTCR